MSHWVTYCASCGEQVMGHGAPRTDRPPLCKSCASKEPDYASYAIDQIFAEVGAMRPQPRPAVHYRPRRRAM